MNRIDSAGDTATPEALARIDLNLVVAFDALARERSVTLAAQRVGVTQSAMSHTLSRLRVLFSDPLFVRSAGGMALTPRAELLITPLRSALVAMAHAFSLPSVFDPRTTRRAFSLATPDLFDLLVIPPLLARFATTAPGVDLMVTSADPRHLALQLETGEVDVGIVPRMTGGAGAAGGPEIDRVGIVRRTLLKDHFVCLLRGDHPVLRTKDGRRGILSLQTFAALSHVLVSPRGTGRGVVDEALDAQGLARRVALRVPSFFTALGIVAQSDLVMTGPAALAQVLPEPGRVVALGAPLRLPSHTVELLWHERFSKDPGHVWLREALADVARTITDGLGRGPVHSPRRGAPTRLTRVSVKSRAV